MRGLFRAAVDTGVIYPWVVASTMGLVALLAGCATPGTQEDRSVRTGTTRPIERAQTAVHVQPAMQFRNQTEDIAYIGREACRSCHIDVYNTYVQTGMGRAFYPMSAEVAVEDFSGQQEVVVEGSGLRYRAIERNGRFFQRQYMLDSRGREIAVDERELIWVVGSNHHSRSYIVEVGDKLFQAPICWYPQEKMWELCPGYEFKNDHFARETSESCLHCHNGRMVTIEGKRNEFQKPYPHGIGCERCHGPGELHVTKWSSGGGNAPGEVDDTIVNPRHMSPQDRIHVCFQCHLGDAKATERVVIPGSQIAAFRPGQPITDVTIPMTYVEAEQSGFGLSAQGDRLLLSRCYLESEGELDCLTCHNPHVTVYREDRPPDFFREKCVGCHATEACSAPADERRATLNVADDCVACHMRRAEPDDQRFTEFTDHWIRRRIDFDEDHRDRFDVRPVFGEHLASLSPGEQAYYEARALWLMAKDVPESKRRSMWLAAEKTYREALSHGYDNVEIRFFLGKTLRQLGDVREAVEQFERAHQMDPAYHGAAYALGQAMLGIGKVDRAVAIFEKMLERDPGDPMVLAEMARAHSMRGQAAKGLMWIDRAIAEEPWNDDLRLNRARLLATLGRFEQARISALEAVRLNPDNPDGWLAYEKIHEALGDAEQAAEGRRLTLLLREAAKAHPSVALSRPAAAAPVRAAAP